MDYKELIEKLREKDGCHCECVLAAAAIETLLAERDAAVAERNAAVDELRGVCKFCKHSPPSFRKDACYDCGGDNHNWQWRGPIPIESTERTEE